MKVTKSGRLLFQLAVSMPPTDGTASGLLATPTSTANQLSPSMMKHRGCQLWATPTARDWKHGSAAQVTAPRSESLPDQVAMWPTPNASNFNEGESVESFMERRERLRQEKKNGNGAGIPLAIAVQMYPTPTTVSGNNNGRLDEWGGKGNPFRGTKQGSGKLNARWVEWLMGYPDDWTEIERPDSKDSETP